MSAPAEGLIRGIRVGCRGLFTGVTAPETPSTTMAGQRHRSPSAEIVCAERAAESRRGPRRRVIDDPFARHFVTRRRYRALVSSRPTAAATLWCFDRLYPGLLAIVLLRHRWFEQVLAETLADGVDQVVLLGAGYDTTALRTSLPAVTLYEVDAPPTQADKRALIAEHGLDDGAVRYVPCDFERDSLPTQLVQHGFDPTARSLIAWWGVSFFLTEHAVRTTLGDIAAVTAPGSRVVFDYTDPDVADGTTPFRGARRAVAAVARRGEPYHFGIGRDEVPSFLSSFGFRVANSFRLPSLAAECAPQFPYRLDDAFGVVDARRVS